MFIQAIVMFAVIVFFGLLGATYSMGVSASIGYVIFLMPCSLGLSALVLIGITSLADWSERRARAKRRAAAAARRTQGL
ncbi:hypothetical protein [Aeromonas salmonicida]|uniref:hypothetical protein n=1 Tax=Aeromonas salmonicida TaxID=645 RepID=UPI00073BF0D4|nr:hypothetical protein [Aeromonas salmonicida]KTA75839.1 hypothetical protein VO69_21455 [Aeromonas salmonicida]MDE7526817.1 hypothetical protein [Aeromonas salmonicida]MDE7530853.1 hypothetical protein [Aeromonas salmonicida]MDE7530864.1 hypothetical protein [Aeromonas salmonicida]